MQIHAHEDTHTATPGLSYACFITYGHTAARGYFAACVSPTRTLFSHMLSHRHILTCWGTHLGTVSPILPPTVLHLPSHTGTPIYMAYAFQGNRQVHPQDRHTTTQRQLCPRMATLRRPPARQPAIHSHIHFTSGHDWNVTEHPSVFTFSSHL